MDGFIFNKHLYELPITSGYRYQSDYPLELQMRKSKYGLVLVTCQEELNLVLGGSIAKESGIRVGGAIVVNAVTRLTTVIFNFFPPEDITSIYKLRVVAINYREEDLEFHAKTPITFTSREHMPDFIRIATKNGKTIDEIYDAFCGSMEFGSVKPQLDKARKGIDLIELFDHPYAKAATEQYV